MIKPRKAVLAVFMSFVMLASSIFINAGNTTIPSIFEQYAYTSYSEYINVDLLFPEVTDIFELFQGDEAQIAFHLEMEHIMKAQESAINAYNTIMAAFSNEYGYLTYRYNYAGAYIDYDTLVIKLTDTSFESTDFYTTLLGVGAPIRFKQVEFSLNELIAFGREFAETINAPIVSMGFNTKANTFNVTLYENSVYSLQILSGFDEMIRELPTPITITLGQFSVPTSLSGGSKISNVTGSEFSAGLTGFYHTEGTDWPALITTGHSFRTASANAPILFNGLPIGNLHTFRFGSHSAGIPRTVNGDWAIITLNDLGANMMTNNIQNGMRVTAFQRTVPIGTIVRGSSAITPFWWGTVYAVNQDITGRISPNVYVTAHGLTTVTAAINPAHFPTNGDSGGIIYTFNGNTATMVGVAAGTRRDFDTNEGVAWHFSPLVWTQSFHHNTRWARFHFDGQMVTIPISVGEPINPALIPVPATRYGSIGTPGQAFLGWYEITTLFQPQPHLVTNPNRAVPIDLRLPITADMLNDRGYLELHGQWLQFGDVMGHGVVDGRSVTRLRQFLNFQITEDEIILETADVLAIGVVDGRAVTRIQQFLNLQPVILGPTR